MDLDGANAERHFFGKTLSNAKQMFARSFSIHQEDLMWMGPKAFCFYLPAAIEVAESPEFAKEELDDLAVGSLISVFEFQWDGHAKDLAGVRGLMLGFCRRVLLCFPEWKAKDKEMREKFSIADFPESERDFHARLHRQTANYLVEKESTCRQLIGELEKE